MSAVSAVRWTLLLVALLVSLGVTQGQNSRGHDDEGDALEAPNAAKPRVLLFGDVRLQAIHRRAATAMEESAEVVLSPWGWLDTTAALGRLDEILGEARWDLIVFNFGMCDLFHRDPRTDGIRPMSPAAGGKPANDPEAFAKNLRTLVGELRSRTGASVLWTTTPPLPPGYKNTAVLVGAVELYNTAAAAVMEDLDVPIVDLHTQITLALEKATDGRRPGGRDFNQLMRTDLSPPLVEAGRWLLDARRR